MKRVLIIGSKGMAGHVITNLLKESGNYIVADISRNNEYFKSVYNFDVSDKEQLTITLSEFKPNIVINGIGILNKDAENNPDNAIYINSYLPHFLAKKGDELGFKLIHISTDCVFSGKTGGYSETSIKDGVGFYAQSKAIGEVNYGKHLTIRTSIIGPELKNNGIGLFDWFMQQDGEIKGFKNAYWTGVTTIELAKAILFAINKDSFGLRHLVNGNKISKYDLLFLLKKIFSKNNISIIADSSYVIDKSLLKSEEIFYEVSSYDEMLIDMFNWMSLHQELYRRYFNKKV